MSSLLAERGPIHVHVGATILLEGEPPALEELLDHVEGRLGLVPRFRQRVKSTPLGLTNPVWADDPRFDLGWHVRHTALPRPGTMAQLRELVGRVMSQPLDLERPLWQLYLSRAWRAGATPTSRRRTTRSSTASRPSTWGRSCSTRIPREPRSRSARSAGTPTSRARRCSSSAPPPRGFARRCAPPARRRAARSRMPRGTASAVMRTAEGFANLAARGPSAPHTFLNQEIGRDRRVGFVSTELAALKRARGDGGATVNDVILSIVAGGLRRLFERRGEPLPEQLVALVPMSIRRPDEHLELGNRIATLMVSLPLSEADPVRRLERVHEETDPGQGVRAGPRRFAGDRGQRLDAADHQPRARRRPRPPADLEPGRLQRPGPAGALLPPGPEDGRGLPVRAPLAAGARAVRRRGQLRRRRLLRAGGRSRPVRRHRRGGRRPRGGAGRAAAPTAG